MMMIMMSQCCWEFFFVTLQYSSDQIKKLSLLGLQYCYEMVTLTWESLAELISLGCEQ